MSDDTHVGKIGEQIATRFLLGKGYEILASNYRKNHGEIDFIAKDLDIIVFVEVKTISHIKIDDVTRETYRPEFNVDKRKIELISRTAQLYMIENSLKCDWRIDLVAVELQKNQNRAKVRHLKSIHL